MPPVCSLKVNLYVFFLRINIFTLNVLDMYPDLIHPLSQWSSSTIYCWAVTDTQHKPRWNNFAMLCLHIKYNDEWAQTGQINEQQTVELQQVRQLKWRQLRMHTWGGVRNKWQKIEWKSKLTWFDISIIAIFSWGKCRDRWEVTGKNKVLMKAN